MISCNRIQRLVDEAEADNSLSFEANLHLESCADCRTFADERMRLRALLGALPSITVPANFNGQLKARLDEAKAKQSFAWLSPAVYLRFGTATAVLAIAVFAVQYSGMFTEKPLAPNTNIAMSQGTGENPEGISPRPVAPPLAMPTPNNGMVQTPSRQVYAAAVSVNPRRPVRIARRNVEETADSLEMSDYSERTVRPFSVGAQDRIYMRADSATPVRTVSF